MVHIETGQFVLITAGSFYLGALIAVVLMKVFNMSMKMQASGMPTKTSGSSALYSSSSSMHDIVGDSLSVVFRTDNRYVPNTEHIVKDLGGEVTYSNRDNPGKLYGVVKAKIPKNQINNLRQNADLFDYVTDIDVKTRHPYSIKHSEKMNLDELSGKLYPKDRILPENRSGHDLIVSSAYSYQLKELFEEAGHVIQGSKNDVDRILKLRDLVYQRIEYKDSDSNLVHLEDSLRYGGVCKEKAATLQLLLQNFGIESRFRRGIYKSDDVSGKHAWVEVDVEGKTYIVDPTNKLFGTEDYLKNQGVTLKLGKNMVERSVTIK